MTTERHQSALCSLDHPNDPIFPVENASVGYEVLKGAVLLIVAVENHDDEGDRYTVARIQKGIQLYGVIPHSLERKAYDRVIEGRKCVEWDQEPILEVKVNAAMRNELL